MSWIGTREIRLWEPEEDMALRRLHAAGVSWVEIARQHGRTVGSVESRARKLKLTKGRSSSRPWSERRAGYGPPGVPLDLGPGDARYVALCLAQGGFVRRVELPSGQIVEVRP